MYFAFDTSNYKTSAAYFDAETLTGRNFGQLLPVEQGSLGLRQSEAVFAHTKYLADITAKLFEGHSVSALHAVGASIRPRSMEGSYMPCFLVGETNARNIALVNGIPFYGFSHQQGHITAAAYSAGHLELLKQPFLAWHLSGGTTELLYVTPDEDEIIKETIIGCTTDISAGQLIDRTGVMLGLPFPAGPALSQLAESALPLVKPHRIKVADAKFSLSGMENKVHTFLEQGLEPEKICAFVLQTVAYTISEATVQALEKYPGLPVLCSGGVMSNRFLAERMKARFNAYFAEPQLSSDNALGIAILTSVKDGASFWNRI